MSDQSETTDEPTDETSEDLLRDLSAVIEDRKENLPEGSYTTSLFTHEKGENRALEKLGEEATEFVLAAKDADEEELAHEGADIVYHMLVVLAMHDVDVDDLLDELRERR
ncbi:phosphoribosyl-ATP diphosphatase [Halospeciosus flavus]|uniref:Phosphoribosyl-ATP pyrophosphatase n=1 Tax=Halospeciosus flavus TaxID=3032283 RepID=A0ABD5Z6M0_9EURY|nr:phosphoribosyl-ATP diphosphatase [Halospeciosus flavus]